MSGFEGAGEQVILHLIIADATPRTINGVFPALERHFPIDHFESELVPPTDANRDTETLTGKVAVVGNLVHHLHVDGGA